MIAALRVGLRWVLRGLGGMVLVLVGLILIYRFVPVPATPYHLAESWRLGGVQRTWVPLTAVAPDMARAVVAAEDANFCTHFGFDVAAIRAALSDGAARGGSTISQQVAKNVFLWHGRSWLRKGLEAAITPMIELFWPKRRIVEVYLNIAEFDTGVFGVEAAAQGAFGVSAAGLSLRQASLLAMTLPNPKARSAVSPSPRQDRRARQIASGAETIAADGRAACFED